MSRSRIHFLRIFSTGLPQSISPHSLNRMRLELQIAFYLTFCWIPSAVHFVTNYSRDGLDSTQVEGTVAQIVNDYDFILLPEQMDESLVAMSFIMVWK